MCVNNLDSTTDEFIFIGEKLAAERLGTVWLSPSAGPTRNIGALMEYGTMNTRASYRYSPYGKIIEQSGDLADANPYRFSSKYYDKETEFVSYFYRSYRSDIGRFISRDSIGEKGGFNLYGFVNNNVISNYDLRGMLSLSICFNAYLPGASQETKDAIKGCKGKKGAKLKKCLLDAGLGVGISTAANIFCCTKQRSAIPTPCDNVRNETQCQDCCTFNFCVSIITKPTVFAVKKASSKLIKCKANCNCADYSKSK